MSRIPAVLKLTPVQHATVDAVLRKWRFSDLDGMVAELAEAGITISRSALHRYAAKLRKSKSVPPAYAPASIVVVIDAQSGATITVPSHATPEAIAALIEGSAPPDSTLPPA